MHVCLHERCIVIIPLNSSRPRQAGRVSELEGLNSRLQGQVAQLKVEKAALQEEVARLNRIAADVGYVWGGQGRGHFDSSASFVILVEGLL